MTDEKHYNTRIDARLGNLAILWADLSDTKRLELLKSIIWTAPDMHTFHAKAEKLITSRRFKSTLD